ncbi:cytochrome P450 [Paraburkholderia panacisoli]|nr:cytochrome P450 [Paraburkholderia panacisoli]
MTVRRRSCSVFEDTEIDGGTLPRGTFVLLSLGAANRDPAKFEEPDRLII